MVKVTTHLLEHTRKVFFKWIQWKKLITNQTSYTNVINLGVGSFWLKSVLVMQAGNFIRNLTPKKKMIKISWTNFGSLSLSVMSYLCNSNSYNKSIDIFHIGILLMKFNGKTTYKSDLICWSLFAPFEPFYLWNQKS